MVYSTFKPFIREEAMTASITPAVLSKAEIYVFRAPIAVPVRTSFGTMHDRPAVFLRLEDADGAYGWGEAWCNFPACGAEHRARLLESVLVPLLLGRRLSPERGWTELSRAVEVLALQADEPGPLAQSVACVDLALWDLAARRAQTPLHAVLGGAGLTAMPAYASGINHPGVADTIARTREEGYRAFKVKIGFGEEQDLRNVHNALDALREGEQLALDVNQAWDLPQALRMAEKLEGLPLLWLEEPLRCDRPAREWLELAAACRIPLAGGENVRGREAFSTAIADGALAVIQPDICKWGGLSQCRAVAAQALKAGRRYCPHYLGAGVGLTASAHLLAALGGNGMLEVDCNPNPLREAVQPFPPLRDGLFHLGGAPGLGAEPDMEGLKRHEVFYKLCR